MDPVTRYARKGLWALPVFAASLFAGTITHQPPPQTDMADWSRYVTTTEFLISHLAASIGGAIFAIVGVVALGIVLAQRGSIRLGLWGLLTGVIANALLLPVFGIAAFAQPAIGRFYLAGYTTQAQALYYDAAQGTPMVVTALIAALLLSISIVLFGVAVARSNGLPRVAGIAFAISGPLFALVGASVDNWIETAASTLMFASLVWIVISLRQATQPAPARGVSQSLEAAAVAAVASGRAAETR